LLANLAQVYSKKGDDTKAEELLRKGLQVDPNQENGLQWLVEIVIWEGFSGKEPLCGVFLAGAIDPANLRFLQLSGNC
jgi:hypothetical protein